MINTIVCSEKPTLAETLNIVDIYTFQFAVYCIELVCVSYFTLCYLGKATFKNRRILSEPNVGNFMTSGLQRKLDRSTNISLHIADIIYQCINSYISTLISKGMTYARVICSSNEKQCSPSFCLLLSFSIKKGHSQIIPIRTIWYFCS